MKARAGWMLVVGLVLGCGGAGDAFEEGAVLEQDALVDKCTGDEVGYVADTGEWVLDDGRILPPPDMDPEERFRGVSLNACPSTSPDTEPGMTPQDTGSVAATDHAVCVPFVYCCQELWAEWCWNGSCSSEYVYVCEWW